MNITYSWQGTADTDFANAANWFDVTDDVPAAAPPGPGDAILLSGSGSIEGTATGLASLTVSATSGTGYSLGTTLDVAAITVGGALTLTGDAGITAGVLTIGGGVMEMQSGSALSASADALDISVSGRAGSASSLRIDAGAALYTGSGSIEIGDGAGQAGTLLVGGTLVCDLGGQLAIGALGARGSVEVTGAITVASGVGVGISGQGLLALDPGAQLEADNLDGGAALVLGTTASGLSSVAGSGTLTSLGATIAVSSDTQIGDTGRGYLVAGGGTLSTAGVTLGVETGSAGTLSIGASEVWTDDAAVVVGAAGNGTLLMTAYAAGAGSVALSSLSLGTDGGSGSVAIAHETLQMLGATELGAGGGTNSIVLGAGGVWLGGGQALILDASGGAGGNTLSVSGSGAVLNAGTLFGFAGSRIAFGAGARASIGADSNDTFGSSGGSIAIAGATLSVAALMGIQSGATISMSGASLSATGGLLILDPTTTASFTGGVASLSAASATTLLIANGGTLAIGGGAQVNVNALHGQGGGAAIETTAGGAASLASVTGGAHWSVAGALAVAPLGAGELDISGGGTVVAGSVSVGGTGAAHGSLFLAGSGDTLSTGLLSIGATGTVTLGGGSHLSAGGLSIGTAAQGTLAATSGSLAIAGGKLSVFGGASVHGGVVLSQGGTLAVSNGLTLAAGSTIIGQGVLSASGIADLGRIGCNTGTMTCLGPVGGTGLLSVANGGDIIMGQGEASTVGLVFGANGTFTASGVGLISGAITGWTTGDALDFTGARIASDSLSGHVLTLFDGAGHVLGRETFAGTFGSNNFSLSSDHGTGTILGFHG